MIRVLVADDHAMVRAGLEQLIGGADDMVVVGAARDGAEAVELAAATNPDVVLMDLEMPNLDGVQATRELAESGALPRVVILTSFSDRDRILAALDAGAIGYVLKDERPEALLRDIRVANAGESPLAPLAASVILANRPSSPGLTEREEEVLRLLAEGLANKVIARRLGIREKTVKSHLTRVFRVIGVGDRTSAALWAQQRLPL